MPKTRGDTKHEQFYHSQYPKMSPAKVSFGVSELFHDQSNPYPVRSSKAVRECLDHVASCMGERIHCNSRFTVSPGTLPTGTYGQEATFQCDPSQRNQEGYTIGNIIRQAKAVEDRQWGTEGGRDEIRETIARFVRENPKNQQQQQQPKIRGSGSSETTIERDRESLGRNDRGKKYNEGETHQHGQRKTGRVKNPGRVDYKRGESYPQYDYGTIAPSTAMGWLIHEAGYSPTSGMEREIPSNTTLPFASSSQIETDNPSTSPFLYKPSKDARS